MKKSFALSFIFLLFASVFFISFVSADFFGSWFDENSGVPITGQVTGNVVASACIDSDSGKNYFTKGTTSGIDAKTNVQTSQTDRCSNRRTLIEYFCNNDGKVASVFNNCASGCGSGICKGTAPATPSTATTTAPTTTNSASATTTTTPSTTARSAGTRSATAPIQPRITSSFQGYLVELKEQPLALKKANLDKEAKANVASGITAPTGISRYLTTAPTLPENVNAKLQEQKTRVQNEHSNFKRIAATRISSTARAGTANSFLSLITGKATSNADLEITSEYTKAFNGFAMNITTEQANQLKTLSEVKAVYPNFVIYGDLVDSVPFIDANSVWSLDKNGNNCVTSGKDCLTGKGITIGIIDSGVDYTHPDLGNCPVTGNINDGSCSKVIGGYDFVNNDNDPMDDYGHGTPVAATAAGNGILKGVAPDSKIVGYKVLNQNGGGYWNNVISGIERSVDPNQDGDFSDHLDVISLSLGGPGNPDDALSRVIDNAVDAGVVAVISAGNLGPDSGIVHSPGTARRAITVGAIFIKDYPLTTFAWPSSTDTRPKKDQIVSFSSRGPVSWTDDEGNAFSINKPDVVAPGIDICSARVRSINFFDGFCYNSKYDPKYHDLFEGTSAATPHVSGVVALLLQKNPDLTPEEIKIILKNTAVDLKDSNGNSYDINTQGAGRINILNAIIGGDKQKTCSQTRTLTRQTNLNLCTTEETKTNAKSYSGECNKYVNTPYVSGRKIKWKQTCYSKKTYYDYNCVKTIQTQCSGNPCPRGTTERSSLFCIKCENINQCISGSSGLYCNDKNAAVSVSSIQEICGDNKDNNCNGQVDENCKTSSCGDGFCDLEEIPKTCTDGEGQDYLCYRPKEDCGICALDCGECPGDDGGGEE
ncbi:S8 family serine peptidase [Candidatus Pacearchaeota archaeon]|nr:S8 family serine peptidase [Candidatus Pacearchaeota archaeon]